MSLIPSGKKRIMVAQAEGNQSQGLDWSQFDKAVPSQDKIMNGLKKDVAQHQSIFPADKKQDLKQVPLKPEDRQKLVDNGLMGAQNPQIDNKDGSQDIAEYIFKKLQSFGYPPRRLQQFKQNFLQQKLYPGGQRDVTVTVPDRYYGTNKRLSDKDYGAMIRQIQSKFKLSFTDGQRGKNKQITVKFSTKPQNQVQPGQEQSAPDILDEVYGTSGQKKQKVASNIMKDLFKKG